MHSHTSTHTQLSYSHHYISLVSSTSQSTLLLLGCLRVGEGCCGNTFPQPSILFTFNHTHIFSYIIVHLQHVHRISVTNHTTYRPHIDLVHMDRSNPLNSISAFLHAISSRGMMESVPFLLVLLTHIMLSRSAKIQMDRISFGSPRLSRPTWAAVSPKEFPKGWIWVWCMVFVHDGCCISSIYTWYCYSAQFRLDPYAFQLSLIKLVFLPNLGNCICLRNFIFVYHHDN